jgi:hypothetical protein
MADTAADSHSHLQPLQRFRAVAGATQSKLRRRMPRGERRPWAEASSISGPPACHSMPAQSRNAGWMIGRELAGTLAPLLLEWCAQAGDERSRTCGGAALLPDAAREICWQRPSLPPRSVDEGTGAANNSVQDVDERLQKWLHRKGTLNTVCGRCSRRVQPSEARVASSSSASWGADEPATPYCILGARAEAACTDLAPPVTLAVSHPFPCNKCHCSRPLARPLHLRLPKRSLPALSTFETVIPP